MKTLDMLRQAVMLHAQLRREEYKQRRRSLNREARDAVGRPITHGEAETMIIIDGEAVAPGSLNSKRKIEN